jgi:hypothetical protein
MKQLCTVPVSRTVKIVAKPEGDQGRRRGVKKEEE